jgi:hypothetical protein
MWDDPGLIATTIGDFAARHAADTAAATAAGDAEAAATAA